MISENGAVKRRKLSLDIESASKVVNLRPAVWKTPTDYQPPTIKELRVDFALNGTAVSENRAKRKKKKKKKIKRNDEGDLSPTTPPVAEPRLSFREKYLTWRYAMVFLFQSSFVVAVFLRNNMPVALVCMAKPATRSSSSSTNSSVGEGTMQENSSRLEIDYEFAWEGQAQSLLLTASILLSFAGPLLANALQPCINKKNLLAMSSLCAALLTVMCPGVARLSPYGLAAIRVVLGILFGFNVPVVGDSLAWWSPQGEKLTMVSLTFSGINVGGIFTSSISGFLCSIPLDNGWPFIFYVFGFLAVVWVLAWHFLSSQKPEEHPFISEAEKTYIITRRANLGDAEQKEKKKEKPPYGKILRSIPVLAFMLCGCCHIWVVTLLVAYLPIYQVEVLGFSVQQAGVIISVSVVGRMLGALFWSWLGNSLSSRFNTRMSRKLCLIIGFSSAGLTLIGMSFFDRSTRWVSFSLLMVSSLAQSVGVSTMTAVPLDMAPRYAGLLQGMFISVASLVAISGPPIVSLLTPMNSHSEWQIVLCIVGGVNLLAALVFGVLGSASIQPWAKIHRKSMPEIASPFVEMGRRLSTFMDRPPITPVSPVPGGSGPGGAGENKNGVFVFTLDVKTGTTHIIPRDQETTDSVEKDFGYVGDIHLANVVSGDSGDMNGQDGSHRRGLDNKAFGDSNVNGSDDDNSSDDHDEVGDGDNDLWEKDEDCSSLDSHETPQRLKRAYSECGLEVLKIPRHSPTETDNEIDLHETHLLQENAPIWRKRKTGVVERPTDIHSTLFSHRSISVPGERPDHEVHNDDDLKNIISIKL